MLRSALNDQLLSVETHTQSTNSCFTGKRHFDKSHKLIDAAHKQLYYTFCLRSQDVLHAHSRARTRARARTVLQYKLHNFTALPEAKRSETTTWAVDCYHCIMFSPSYLKWRCHAINYSELLPKTEQKSKKGGENTEVTVFFYTYSILFLWSLHLLWIYLPYRQTVSATLSHFILLFHYISEGNNVLFIYLRATISSCIFKLWLLLPKDVCTSFTTYGLFIQCV